MTPTHTATPPAKWLQTLPGAVITRTLVSWRHLPQVWARTLAPARPNIWTSSTTVTPHPPPQPLPLPPRLLRRHLPPSHRPRPLLSQLQLLVLTQVSQEFISQQKMMKFPYISVIIASVLYPEIDFLHLMYIWLCSRWSNFRLSFSHRKKYNKQK